MGAKNNNNNNDYNYKCTNYNHKNNNNYHNNNHNYHNNNNDYHNNNNNRAGGITQVNLLQHELLSGLPWLSCGGRNKGVAARWRSSVRDCGGARPPGHHGVRCRPAGGF